MKELKIPCGVKKIENQYNDLTDYDVIIIPPTVRVISNSFNNCLSVTKILFETDIDDSYKRFDSFDDYGRFNSYYRDYSEDIYSEKWPHHGVAHIINSFNKAAINSLSIPYTTVSVKGSFSSCTSLSQIIFEVFNDPKKRHKGFGVGVIEDSFDYIPVEQLTIPATVDSITSSFKECHLLSNLTFECFNNVREQLTYGVKNISSDSFHGSNLKDVKIPPTVKGIDRIDFQAKQKKEDFSKKKYTEGGRIHNGNEICIFDKGAEAASLFIYKDGSSEYKVHYNIGEHQYQMWGALYRQHIVASRKCPDLFNVFDGGVMLAKNGIVAFVIDGVKCSVFLPDNLLNEQLKSLLDLINLMNDRQNKNSDFNFEMHIFYKDYIYDEINGDDINLRSFVYFLIEFGIFDGKDFDFISDQSNENTKKL